MQKSTFREYIYDGLVKVHPDFSHVGVYGVSLVFCLLPRDSVVNKHMEGGGGLIEGDGYDLAVQIGVEVRRVDQHSILDYPRLNTLIDYHFDCQTLLAA